MLKKMIKNSLIAVAGVLFAMQASASEIKGTFSGEASAIIASKTESDADDSFSYVDGTAEATFRYDATLTEGEWKGSGHALFTFDEDGFTAKHRWVTLQNESTAFSLGYWKPGHFDIAQGKEYLDGIYDGSMGIGDAAFAKPGNSFFKVGLKNLGLEFALGVNRLGKEDATGDAGLYNETAISAKYEAEFGDLAVSARVTSVGESIDEKQNTGGKDSKHDGAGKTDAGFGVGYTIGSAFLALHADQLTEQYGGDPKPDPVTTTTLLAVVDIALDDSSGISVSLGTETVSDESDNDQVTTQFDAGYMKSIAGVNLSLGYSANTVKDPEDGTDEVDTGESTLCFAMTFAF